MSTPPPQDSPGDGLERGQVQTFVLALDKALRAQRLYGSRDSAFVVKLLDTLERELSELLARGAVQLGVRSVGFTWDDRPLFTAGVDDVQLPWAFRLFCDGIRELTFEQQLRWDELLDFLDILSTNPRATEEDLVTMMWERDFDGIQYYAADTFAAGLEIDENGELVLASHSRLEGDEGPEAESFALGPDDIRLLAGERHLAWLEAARTPTRSGGAHAWQAAMLKGSLQDVADLPRFMQLALEVVGRNRLAEGSGLALVTDQLSAHIARRDLDGFIAYFEALAAMASSGGERARGIVTKVLIPARHEAIVPMLVEAEHALDRVPAGLLASGATAALTRLLESLPACPFQQALEKALIDARVDLTPLYAERLGSTDHTLVSASIEALGRIGSPEAIKALATVLSRPSTRQRHEALAAMIGNYHPSAKGALVRCLDDPTEATRVKTLAVLREAHDPAVVRALLHHMRDTRFEKRSLEECAAWYRCLGSAPDSSALSHLEGILLRRNLLRSQGVIAHQILAVRTLGQLGGSEARQVLEQAYSARHLPRQVKFAIRSAVSAGSGA
jgi:hypothetical protein